MAEIIYMPKLSDTMTEGVVAEWHKKVGDTVKSGELLAEIETDKATMEFESFYDCVLLHIGIEKGKATPVNALLAIIGEKGEDVSAIIANPGTPSGAAAPEKKAEKTPEEKNEAASAPSPEPAATIEKPAEEKGVDLGFISGSGEGGRITKRDVDHYVPYDAPQRPASATGGSQTESYTDETISQMRKTIARR